MRHAYPMMLDVSRRLIVIVGGGRVAARKAAGLLDAGATLVRVVAPQFDPAMPNEVTRVPERFEPRHLDGAGLVFAATDSADVNDEVVTEAHRRGLLACRADSDERTPGDFATPAKFERGPITVTVSAGSAALSARIRDDLKEHFDPRWQVLADAMTILRPTILQRGADPDRRAAALRALASPEALAIAGDGVQALERWIAVQFPELHGPTRSAH